MKRTNIQINNDLIIDKTNVKKTKYDSIKLEHKLNNKYYVYTVNNNFPDFPNIENTPILQISDITKIIKFGDFNFNDLKLLSLLYNDHIKVSDNNNICINLKYIKGNFLYLSNICDVYLIKNYNNNIIINTNTNFDVFYNIHRFPKSIFNNTYINVSNEIQKITKTISELNTLYFNLTNDSNLSTTIIFNYNNINLSNIKSILFTETTHNSIKKTKLITNPTYVTIKNQKISKNINSNYYFYRRTGNDDQNIKNVNFIHIDDNGIYNDILVNIFVITDVYDKLNILNNKYYSS
jgi:hypothetical protein